MKILMFSDHGPGSTTFIKQDALELNDLCDLIYICSLGKTAKDPENIIVKNIPFNIYSLKSKLFWRLENLDIAINFKNKGYSRELNKIIDNFNPDIIHCQFAYEALKLFDNTDISSIPIVLSFRGYDASYKLQKKVYQNKLRVILRKPNVYPTFVCEYLKKQVESKGIILNKNIILYTGVNLNTFKRTNYFRTEPYTFIQVGAFNEKKGQQFTIKAFKKFIGLSNNKNIKLKFIGDGLFLNECISMAEKSGLSENIEFMGNLSQKAIINELDKAICFVHHSITADNGDQEGIPNAIIEAMAMELPVLSTYHAGIPEAVEDGVNGLLCEEKDIETYSQHMLKVLSWGFLKENRKKVEDKFCFTNHINKLVSFYSEVSL